MKVTDILRKVDTVDPDETKKWLADKKEGGFSLIDVREPSEYEDGHLPGAILMPLSELADRLKELDPSKPTITYCRMGGRSLSAASFMKGQGFREVYSMKGGINAWNGHTASGQYESGMFLIQGKKKAEEYISLSWALEEGTRQFYENIRESLYDEDAKNIYKILVNAEEKHKAKLLDTYGKITGLKISGESLDADSLKGVMEGGISIEEATAWIKAEGRTFQDMLELSMQIEINSLDLYIKIFREIEDLDAKKVYQELIKEEKTHLSHLGKLIDRRKEDPHE